MRNHFPFGHRSLTCLLALLSLRAVPAHAVGDSVCAQVTIQLNQQVVITRTAFQATLQIDNASTEQLEEVLITLDIRDVEGNPANDRFGIPQPVLQNVGDVSGTGVIAPQTVATAQWLILPTDLAAPTPDAETYFIGGQVSHFQGGALVSVPLYPAEIQVLPDAELFLKYFLQSPVYSDNPFTMNAVEPAEPFSLGLLVTNAGFGPANNVSIMSSQPEIVENRAGLLIAFQIIGTQVGTQTIAPSLTVDLGDIAPDGSAVARWLMTATLQGEFISYEATFEHVNGLGNPALSLIESVTIYELNHVVLLDGAGQDGLPDFLVNDPPAQQEDDVPDIIHSSDGTLVAVRLPTSASVDDPPTEMDQVVLLTVTAAQPGWHFIRIDDPGGGAFALVQVVRNDGGLMRNIPVGGPGDIVNAWTTHRYLPIDGPPAGQEHRLYIVDELPAPGTYTYLLTYTPPLEIVTANPPLDNPFVPGAQPFRDVLQTGKPADGNALTQGIGGAGTPALDTVSYSQITVTFNQAAVLTTADVTVGCNYTGAPAGNTPCPTVTGLSGSDRGPYVLTLSGPIPPGGCTTITFIGSANSPTLRYESLPGDVSMNLSSAAVDVLSLVGAVSNGQAALPTNLPRYDINRSSAVSATDVLRLVQLLNGVNSTQPWGGVSLTPCQ